MKRDAKDAAPRHHHVVQFYGTDESLYETVAGFLSEGLVARDPVIIIASELHRTAILARLAQRLIDVENAQRLGELVVLDAKQMLDTFMTGEVPNADAFEGSIGGLIENTLKGRAPRTVLRAYGEMVDVLWKEGREEAAIRLEMLWNQLATKYDFALLCGYAMGQFYKQTTKYKEVCNQHSHVVDEKTNVVPFERAVRGRVVRRVRLPPPR